MAKSENQKIKLITLKDILLQKTDEEHPMTTQQLIVELEKYGIKAERKSIYQDVLALEDLGLDIVKNTGRTNEYYVASREFELAELKILVDVVQSAKFITEKKSKELIEKLQAQTSQYAAKQLSRSVVIANRNKASNETIFYNVDGIYNAIANNHQISFYYLEWNINKELVPRKNGERYQVSPWNMIWFDENYYLIGYDEKVGIVKHYRVDKMQKLEEVSENRLGKEEMEAFDLARFSKTIFGMFDGEEMGITLSCQEHMIGIILDRFGKDVAVREMENGTVEVRVQVRVSSQFFGWLAALGSGVKIKTPESVREEYKTYIKTILDEMKNE